MNKLRKFGIALLLTLILASTVATTALAYSSFDDHWCGGGRYGCVSKVDG